MNYPSLIYFHAGCVLHCHLPLRSAHHSDDPGGDVTGCHQWYLLLLEPKHFKAWRQSGMYVWISILLPFYASI